MDGRKSFAWTDYRGLIQAAHHQLGGATVLVWDDLNTHLTTEMRRDVTAVRRGVRQLQYLRDVLDGCPASAGLITDG
ncbi:hypothetical protein ACFV2X_12575 [Streptomyces sp. NPDC059679]|uniref:hypothetical protein n=1 Tax=Streptomyces sp. NPDC059679 TaxID=3346903 RepID=UPI0036CEB23E